MLGEQGIDHLQAEFRLVHSEVNRWSDLAAVIEVTSQLDSFEVSWKPLGGRHTLLQAHTGGLATEFPGTVTVESDFSILDWELMTTRNPLVHDPWRVRA